MAIDWDLSTKRFRNDGETALQTVERMYKELGTLPRVADKLYVSHASVGNFLRKNGVSINKRGGIRTSKLDGIDFTGKTPHEIAREARVSLCRVYDYADKNGVETCWKRPAVNGKDTWSRVAWHVDNQYNDNPEDEHSRGM